jgi:preprotein translocase subunit SecD
LYYRSLGIFAAVALVIYVILTLGVFKLFSVTMTLAGIAGFVLTIGMAVDANILIFERMKEELKKGASKAAAIEEGFKRAWTSIRDSNLTTIMTAVILFYFTSSFVKGFALTLLIGVLVSMFSAITVTRTLLRAFSK